MKVLVYVNRLTIGGEQLQAIDLGAAIRDLGNEVVIAAAAGGPLVDWAAKRDLRVVVLNVAERRRPSMRGAWALRQLVRTEKFDLVHAYGVPSTMEAFFGAHVMEGVPLMSSMLSPVSLRVHRRLPRFLPLIMVTPAVQRDVQRMREGSVYLLEPPVDVIQENPSVQGAEFRHAWGLDDGVRNIVIVSRLVSLTLQDKLEGIERSIETVELLARTTPVRLIIVGTGPAYPYLREKVKRVNGSLVRPAIIMTGPLVDPGPAYAVADIVIGHAQSILRGMAFAKPAVVVGDAGFSEMVTPETAEHFLDFGWWGVGNDATPDRLYHQLRRLLEDEALRLELGRFSRELVCQRYSLEVVGRSLDEIYKRALADTPVFWKLIPEIIRTSAWIIAFKSKDRLKSVLRVLQNGGSRAPRDA